MSPFAAIILGAGRASRFRAAGGNESTKLVAHHAGEPLIRHAAKAALASRAEPVVLVTGHAAVEVTAVVSDLRLLCLTNPAFAEGLSTSLRAGIAALPAACEGAVILLGDMPSVETVTIDRLIAHAVGMPHADAVVPICDGQRGNPVLLRRSLFARCGALTGDMGARKLLADPDLHVEELAGLGDAIVDDVDEPADLERLSRRTQGKRPPSMR